MQIVVVVVAVVVAAYVCGCLSGVYPSFPSAAAPSATFPNGFVVSFFVFFEMLSWFLTFRDGFRYVLLVLDTLSGDGEGDGKMEK